MPRDGGTDAPIATRAGTNFAPSDHMRDVEPARRDDYILAVLLLIIGVPRVILAALYERPLGVEGTLSIACVVLAFLVIVFARGGSEKHSRHGLPR